MPMPCEPFANVRDTWIRFVSGVPIRRHRLATAMTSAPLCVDAVAHDASANADHRIAAKLVRLDHDLSDGAGGADAFPNRHRDRSDPPLEANLGHDTQRLGMVREDPRLMHRKSRGLLDRHRDSSLEAPDPDVVDNLGSPDNEGPVRLHRRHDSPAVRGVTTDPEPLSRGRQGGIVNVGNRDQLGIRE